MSSEEETAEKVAAWLRINNPETFKNRFHILKNMSNKVWVVRPSLLSDLCSISEDKKVKVTFFYGGKSKAMTVILKDEELQAVEYDNALGLEVVESGVAEKLIVETAGKIFVFKNMENAYVPLAEEEATAVLGKALYPYYSKNLIPAELWED